MKYTRKGDAKKASAQTSFRCILYYLSLCTTIQLWSLAHSSTICILLFSIFHLCYLLHQEIPFINMIISIIKFSFRSFASFCINNFTQDIILKINLSIISSHALIILLHLECLADFWTRCSLTMRYINVHSYMNHILCKLLFTM